MRSSLERSEQAPGAKTPQRRRVLVVEDEELAYEGLCVELGHRGLVVDVARSVDGAMGRLADTPYDAVTLDIMLPATIDQVRAVDPDPETDHQGIRILHEIRRGQHGPGGTGANVPVVIVTAITDATLHERMRELRPQTIFTKPVATEEVAETVKLLLSED